MAPVERTRGRRWQTIRARVLRAQPLCVECLSRGLIVLAVEVDHIVALEQGGTDDPDNLRGLCSADHKAKTADDMGYSPKGCDANGMPTSPRHPWARG